MPAIHSVHSDSDNTLGNHQQQDSQNSEHGRLRDWKY